MHRLAPVSNPSQLQKPWPRSSFERPDLLQLRNSYLKDGGNDFMRAKTRVLVTGAGGFIGHHLVRRLKNEGFWVRAVDLKVPEFEPSAADDFRILDLRLWDSCLEASRGIDQVYNLAADMGGIGYITANHADISRNNT